MDLEEEMPRDEGTGGYTYPCLDFLGGMERERCLSEVRKGIREGSQIRARVE